MSALWSMIRRLTAGDIAVLLGALALAAALLRPAWTGREVRARIASAISDVDAVSTAARRSRGSRGQWPAAAEPGEAPPELAALAAPGGPFSRGDYVISWSTWEVVDSVAARPDDTPPATPGDAPREPDGPRMEPETRAVGAVAVHTDDDNLLAGLLLHYGSDVSFVLDTVWMMLLPERRDSAAPER